MIHVAQHEAKQHLTDAKDHRDFHFERVEERYLVYSQLPSLVTQHTSTTAFNAPHQSAELKTDRVIKLEVSNNKNARR